MHGRSAPRARAVTRRRNGLGYTESHVRPAHSCLPAYSLICCYTTRVKRLVRRSRVARSARFVAYPYREQTDRAERTAEGERRAPLVCKRGSRQDLAREPRRSNGIASADTRVHGEDPPPYPVSSFDRIETRPGATYLTPIYPSNARDLSDLTSSADSQPRSLVVDPNSTDTSRQCLHTRRANDFPVLSVTVGACLNQNFI